VSNLDKLRAFDRDYSYHTYTIWMMVGRKLHCKVGYTTSFIGRMAALTTGLPEQPCYFCLIAADERAEARRREQIFLRTLEPFRTKGEWFSARDGLHLISAWACAYGLVLMIAQEQVTGMASSGILSDWGVYSSRPNPVGKLIAYMIGQHVAPFSEGKWREFTNAVGIEYDIDLERRETVSDSTSAEMKI
jgi:hypothetical protein